MAASAKLSFVVGLACCALSTGCSGLDRYSLHQAKEDRSSYYRLDKLTGAVTLIEGGHMIRVPEPSKAEQSVGEAHTWDPDSIPRYGVVVRATTKWRDGLLCYRVTLAPIDSLRSLSAQSSVTLHFCDGDGFELTQVGVGVWEGSQVVGRDGKADHFEVEGATAFGEGGRRPISSVRLSWNLAKSDLSLSP